MKLLMKTTSAACPVARGKRRNWPIVFGTHQFFKITVLPLVVLRGIPKSLFQNFKFT